MNAVSFSSVSEASAAFTLGPVRFRCNACDGVHSSRQKGWEPCAKKVFASPRGFLEKHSSGKLFGRFSYVARIVERFEWWDYLGRDFLREIGGRCIRSPVVGPVPELFAVDPCARAELERQVHFDWWNKVVKEVLRLQSFLLEKFPEGFRRPPYPLPSLGKARGSTLFLEDFAVFVIREDYRRVQVVHCDFYCGLEVSIEMPSAEEASAGIEILLSTLGVFAFRPVVADTRVVFKGVSS